MHRRTFLKMGGGAVGTGALAGCTGNGGGGSSGGSSDGDGGGSTTAGGSTTTARRSDDPVMLGALEPLSGNFTPWGNVHREGLKFAIREINADGGVLGGRELDLTVVDTGSDAGKASSAFERMVEQNDVVSASGPVSSDVGIRTRITAQELEVPLFFHMSGSREALTRDTRYAFRMGLHSAPTIVQAHVELARDQDVEKVALIAADYAWGNSILESAEQQFPDSIQLQTKLAPIDQSDFSSYLRQIDDDIDLMIAGGHPPGTIPMVKQMFSLGIEPSLTSGAGFPPDVLVNALGDLAFEGFAHNHVADPTSPLFAEVGKRYAEATGNYFQTHHAYGYVTAKLTAAAIEESGSADPVDIADAIRTISYDTMYPGTIEYHEWGAFKNPRYSFSTLERESPSYDPDAGFRLDNVYTAGPLDAYEP